MKKYLYYAGVLAAVAAVIISMIGSDVGANGMPQDVNPLGGIGMGIAALALFKASELTPN